MTAKTIGAIKKLQGDSLWPVSFVAACFVLLVVAAYPAQAVNFDWVSVGNVGNGPDDTGFGAVDNSYRIATTEVTNNQYATFLNNVAATDTFGVWQASMDITQMGSAGSYTYAATTSFGSKPVRLVSFSNAMRFVNWLENGRPNGSQGPETTEDGTYLISDGISETRASTATFFLPSEDEWYKAAYHKNDGVTANYWDYPNQSDAPPTAAGANFANFVGDTTDVGTYTGTTSAYGGFDFGGNVFEWTEGLDGPNRVIRGGAWNSAATLLAASSRTLVLPIDPRGDFGFGFRIAALHTPEPGTALLGVMGGLLLMLFSGRRFQRRTR